MIEAFKGDFRIKVDTSECIQMITGGDPKLHDIWRYSDQIFESGKIYGIVSEYGQGCMYLSYLLGGREDFGNVKIYINDGEVCRKDLEEASFNLEPNNESYGKKTVKKSIEKALTVSKSTEDFSAVAERFGVE